MKLIKYIQDEIKKELDSADEEIQKDLAEVRSELEELPPIPVLPKCPRCGIPNFPDALFCEACDEPLSNRKEVS
jgi:hypothetical protein